MRKNITTKEHGAKDRLSPSIAKVTKEEALAEAKSEAEAHGISPAAVMHSSPEGAVTGDDGIPAAPAPEPVKVAEEPVKAPQRSIKRSSPDA